MCNLKIRSAAKDAGVKLWQIADRLGMNDGNFSRVLRKELPRERQMEILGIIEDIATGGGQNETERI